MVDRALLWRCPAALLKLGLRVEGLGLRRLSGLLIEAHDGFPLRGLQSLYRGYMGRVK